MIEDIRLPREEERMRRSRAGRAAKLATLLKLCNALHCGLRDILADPETLDLLAAYEERNK